MTNSKFLIELCKSWKKVTNGGALTITVTQEIGINYDKYTLEARDLENLIYRNQIKGKKFKDESIYEDKLTEIFMQDMIIKGMTRSIN